ncbi:DinB family protein [Algoriphagus hitonicola]|uniref:DinB superfamily protein n=1 Tax=Algoriphagus hitonicola TaxID=435880 RepID=A0A1I2RNW2_9BACT|nr:DinB family protein [Algoriphagus hitonicola]SFG41159.1 DinB superfamily protein [Algoriphagus hitonicola]
MRSFHPPTKDEYPAYFDRYLQLNPQQDYPLLIEEQIQTIKELFKSKTSNWAEKPYQAGKWSPKEVLGHVIDTERIMTFRALCFARGERNALPGFDQDPYVLNARFGSVPSALLLEDFENQRKALLTLIQTLPEDSLDFHGKANGTKITPRALFWIIPGHFIHHLTILKERYQ